MTSPKVRVGHAEFVCGPGKRDIEPFLVIKGQRVSGEMAIAEAGFRFKIGESDYPGGRRFDITIVNAAATARTIDKGGLVFAAPTATGKRKWRVFLDGGSSGWSGVKRLDALESDPRLQPVHAGPSGAYHRSDLQSVLWDATSGDTMLVGFLRQQYGANEVDVMPTPDGTDVDRVEAWQDFGFDVPSGYKQPLDPLVIGRGIDPHAMMEKFGEAVMKHQGRKFDMPPIVGMMTWYGYRTAIDEDLVLGNAKVVGELFAGYPQEMQKLMLCDHGWQQDANWGYWEPDQKRFPHGMKWLAEQLAKEGMELGLWYTPFCITKNAPNYKDLVPLQALDRDCKPQQSYASVWGDLPGQPVTFSITFLDAAKEAVQKMWANTLAKMRDWGVVYWKLDFFALQSGVAERSKLGVGELYAKTWKTFREAVGDLKLNPCSCPTNLQLGYDDSVRIASDIGNAGAWPGAMKDYRFGMGTIAGSWYKNRRFWVNDADSVQLAKGCSLNEARVRATVIALSGGHLMVSEDLREVDHERLEMVRRLIPPYPQAARPLDLFENPFPEGYPIFWALTLPTGFGPMTALAVFNLTSRPQQYEITPKMLGIELGKEFLALEWWQYRWLGRFKDKFKVEVPAEDVAVIHAQPIQDVPTMVSVSHHITGGYIVEEVSFDRQKGTLHGFLLTKPGLRVVLFGHLPDGWKLSRCASFHTMLSSVRGWQSEVVTTESRTPFTVEFVKL